MASASPKIAFESVSKLFGSNQGAALDLLQQGADKDDILAETGCTIAVNDASLEIEEGEIFVVMGLSGSGKSTLLRMINGLIAPSSGTVTVAGQDVAHADRRELRELRRDKVAMVFQHFALFPHKSVVDNTAFGLKLRGLSAPERRAKAKEALQQVGLAAYADALPSELSGGMQQRVGLARCLASDPEILLMDEPFSALDPLIRRDMQEDLLELQRRLKKTIVFITHDLHEALVLGDRIAIMKDGAIVQIGTAEEIVDRPADDYVAAFTQDVDRSRVFTAQSVASPAEAIRLGKDSVGAAMRSMEELDRNALHVVDGDRIAGIVTYRDISSLPEAATDFGDALRTVYPSASPTAQLNDLYSIVTAGLPIALVNHKRHLVGVVESHRLLSRLCPDGDNADAKVAVEA